MALLVGVALVGLAARLILASLPLPGLAARASALEAALLVIGSAGLAFHCGAMFFRTDASRIPGTHGAIRVINAMGTSSRVWFIVPAILVVLGLRHQKPVAIAAVALSLIAVGVTMYDHGPLPTHLHAILVAAVVLSAVVALLVRPPWQRATRLDVGIPRP